MTGFFRRLVPTTLAAQLIVLTSAAVLISNIAVAAWFTARHARITEVSMMEHLLDRAASAATLLAGIPDGERRRAVHTMSSGPWHFYLEPDAAALPRMAPDEAALAARVRAFLPETRQREPVTVKLLAPLDAPPPDARRRRHLHRPAGEMVQIILPVVAGTRLVTTFSRPHPPGFLPPIIYALVVSILTAAAAAAFAARRVARPLSKLADAATEVSRGGDAPRVPEEGPDDIRRAARAFNAMTDQVSRVMESQRHLLYAVGHDLRTPITAMRISAEFVADDDVRERLVKNLAELQSLTEAVLGAARGSGWEKRRRIDLAALLESLCADLEDMGQPVRFSGHLPLTITCRANELRRAVRNLLENAVTYGQHAEIRLSTEGDMAVIVIDDAGPGIPEADLARVFEPFVRLEHSRSQETGGAGLGLTLAKSVADSHGGTIRLENRPEGGLRAILRLPLATEAA